MKKKTRITIVVAVAVIVSVIILVMAIGHKSLTFLKYVRNQDTLKVRQILEKQPDLVNVTFKNNATALHVAAINGDVETAKVLLQHGANINAMTTNGNIPLNFAIGNYEESYENRDGNEDILDRRRKMVEFLVIRGADVNHQRGIGGKSVPGALLMPIITLGDKELVELFLIRGVDVNIIHQDIARIYKHKEIEKLLSKYLGK